MRKIKPKTINRDMARHSLVISAQKELERYKKIATKRIQSVFVDEDGELVILKGDEKLVAEAQKAYEQFEEAFTSVMEFDKCSDSMTDEEILERWFQ